MVKLNNFNVNFDCNKETPFFQVQEEYRIRFDIESLNSDIIRSIIEEIFSEKEDINAIFVSEYIFNKKRISAKTKIGQIINLKNWKESIVFEDKEDDGVVYASIKNLSTLDVYNYCFNIKKGFKESYISFYSDTSLIYVSSSVIDIISNDLSNIINLKDKYKNLCNTYYEGANQ